MTKRKASVALDSINETQSNSLKLSANNNGPQEACNRNNIGNNNNNVVVHQQNGTSSSQSMGNGDNNNNNCHLQQEQVDTASNNQNDNSVESNASSGNTSAAGCGGGGQHKSKKERADNWSNAEIQILHKGIESRRDVFYGPPSQATKKNRELAWEAITREVNAVSTTPRSLSQVMKKFKNEKCRAKRKFTDLDKDGHHTNSNNSGAGSNSTSGAGNNSSNSNNNLNSNNNVSNSNQGNNSSTNATNNINTDDTSSSLNLSSQQQQQQQQQHQHQQQQQQQQQLQHHMTGADSMSAHINVVKLAPQNVAKTMIDLPGHVQQIQMPNDDMVLIVPPDMDGLLSGVNIVSDGNGHHHFQKCSGSSALNNLSHNHQNQHPLQTLNTNQSLVNGAMGSAMMSRTIPTGGVCSLVYSTSNELCAPDHHHVTQSVVGQASLATNHLGLGTRNLTHPRGTIIQTQGQQSHHHHMHQHQQQQQQQQPQPQPQTQPQPQPQPQPQHQQSQQQQSQQHQLPQQQSQHQPHPSQLANSHNQQQIPQNHLTTTTAITNPGGVAVESQLKNLLLNLLLKEGPAASVPLLSTNTQDNKHRNDMLAIIASSLTKIESHLGKISKVASTLIAHNSLSLVDNNNESALTNQIHNSGTSGLNLGGSNGNNNNVSMSTSAATIRRDNE